MLDQNKYIEFQLYKISNGWVIKHIVSHEDNEMDIIEVFQDSLKAAKDYLASAVTKYLNVVNEEEG
ncbi:hypothetical protein E3V36_07735 [Candidatus Marinimicrobia bacterium MT.SAG.2]|nr:hypothetical protein E3V36_07735 [Candidatus Marinimicrobia bacterium MT.SAG.2]